MATIIEGSMPISIEGTTNATQHDASGLVESLWSSYSAASNWQIAVTTLLLVVFYDQCKLPPYNADGILYVFQGY